MINKKEFAVRWYHRHKRFVVYILIQFLVIIWWVYHKPKIELVDHIQYDVMKIDTTLVLMTNTILKLAKNDSVMFVQLQHFPTSPPITIKQMTQVSSVYSTRINPITHEKEFHCGVDYRAKLGTPVFAAAAGKVESTKRGAGYGHSISIDHLNGYETLYAHLDEVEVIPDQYVEKGQEIGTVGLTGLTTGPHLHFEIIYEDTKINPKLFTDESTF